LQNVTNRTALTIDVRGRCPYTDPRILGARTNAVSFQLSL